MEGNGETCPVCGRVAYLPEGNYSVDEGGKLTIEAFARQAYDLVAAATVRPEDRQMLREIVREAVEEGSAAAPRPDLLADAIRQRVPALSLLADLLQSTAAANFAQIGGFLIVLLTILLNMGDHPEASSEARENIVQPAIAADTVERDTTRDLAPGQSVSAFRKDPPTESREKARVGREKAKVGRNESCPCGSGKKFKKCHGA